MGSYGASPMYSPYPAPPASGGYGSNSHFGSGASPQNNQYLAQPPQYDTGSNMASTYHGANQYSYPPKGKSNEQRFNWKKAPQDLLGGVDIKQIRNDLEGPKPLRVIAGLSGLAMFFMAGFGLLNIFKVFLHPVKVVLEVYECIFGLVIVCIELKTMSEGFRAMLYKWFPFLSIVGGKGVFYIFAGSMGASWGWISWLTFAPGIAVAAMGIVYCLIHFGNCKTLEDKYEKSMMYSYMG